MVPAWSLSERDRDNDGHGNCHRNNHDAPARTAQDRDALVRNE
jgi:hypothetical protein